MDTHPSTCARRQFSFALARKPANGPVQSYSVADAVVPCRAGAPAAKERNGSGPENYSPARWQEDKPKNLEWSYPL